MPTFIVDLVDSRVVVPETARVEFASREEARRQALHALTEMAHEALPDSDFRDFVATVQDEHGRPLFRAVLSLRGHWLR
jgi:hypothetical protein